MGPGVIPCLLPYPSPRRADLKDQECLCLVPDAPHPLFLGGHCVWRKGGDIREVFAIPHPWAVLPKEALRETLPSFAFVPVGLALSQRRQTGTTSDLAAPPFLGFSLPTPTPGLTTHIAYQDWMTAVGGGSTVRTTACVCAASGPPDWLARELL